MSEAPVLPDFELPATGNQRFQLSACPAPFILHFYPKDDTPGCTSQGSDFRDLHGEFVAAGVAIFGVMKTKNMYGRPVTLPHHPSAPG